MTPERDPFDVFIMVMITVVVLAVAVLAAWVVWP